MILLWLMLIIAVIVFLKYAYLITKRLLLIGKIKKKIKKQNGGLRYFRNPLSSVFRHDGGIDLPVSCHEKNIAVSVLTTPFHRVRYHFNDNGLLELIVERRGVFITNRNRPNISSVMDRYHTVRRYRIEFDDSEAENESQRYVILNPAPISVSKVDGSKITALCDDDILFDRIKVCGLKYFLENVI